MELINKLESLADRLKSLKQLSDIDLSNLQEQIDKIKSEELPPLEDELVKYVDLINDGREPDESEQNTLNQMESLFDQIDASIFSICLKFGLDNSNFDDTSLHISTNEEETVGYDPKSEEFSIVLNEIAKSALKKIEINDTDYRIVEIMKSILTGIVFGETDTVIVRKAFSELLLSGFVLDKDKIKEMCVNTREKCQLQLLGLRIAVDSIRNYDCSAEQVLSQISIFL